MTKCKEECVRLYGLKHPCYTEIGCVSGERCACTNTTTTASHCVSVVKFNHLGVRSVGATHPNTPPLHLNTST